MKSKDRRARRPLIIPSIALILGILIEERLCQLYFIIKHPILGLIPIVGCFYYALMGKDNQQVKINIFACILGMILILINTVNYDWGMDIVDGDIYSINGRITKIEKLEDRTEIVIEPVKNNSTGDGNIHGKILLRVYELKKGIIDFEALGKMVELRLGLEKPKSAGNPGAFDYRRYLYGQGIVATASFKGMNIDYLEESAPFYYRFQALILEAREKFLVDFFEDDESRAIAGGILFGMGRNIPEDIRNAYMEGGAGHILAVSGLHIGILYAICKAIEKKLKIKCVALKKGVLLFLFFVYGTASLWSISVTRAILLVAFKELSESMDYRFDHLSALALISDLMLISRPYLVFSGSFQMSFLAILGICFLKPKISYWIIKVMDRFVARNENTIQLEQVLSTTLSVQILMIPYTIYVHNRFSALALINNWIMIALAGIYVPLAAGAFIVNMIIRVIFPADGLLEYCYKYIGMVLTYLGQIMTRINEAFLLDGKSVIPRISPSPFFIAMFLALVFYVSSESFKIENKRNAYQARIKSFGIMIGAGIITVFLLFNPVSFSDAVFLDVGQGDSLHLSWGNNNLLVDGGGSVNFNVGEKTLKPYLLHEGISTLDIAISTHQHTDHYKGIEELNEVYPISEIITYGKAGDRIELDKDRFIDILWPIPGYEDSDDENYFSRIFKIYDRGITILVTGDITEEGEKALLSYYGKDVLKSDILKVAHHGSRFSTCQEFIDAVLPIIAVISVGENNYGHPAPSVIEKLESSGIIVYRTDRDGAVGIIIGKDRFWVCGNRRNMRIESYNVN